MKKTAILALFIVCSFLKASENPSHFQLELPVYDPHANTMFHLPVHLEKRDPFTLCTFKKLIEKACAQEESNGYHMTVFRCLGLSGLPKFAVADTNAFNRWIAGNGKVNPVTRELIISNSTQKFIINPTNDGKFEIICVPVQSTPAVLYDAKREEESLTNYDIEKAFKEIEAERALRRTKEQAFLRDND